MIQTVLQKVLAFWHSLPHWVQAILILFGTAAWGVLEPRFRTPAAACWTKACVIADFSRALSQGWLAVVTFYMRPGPGRAGGPAVEIAASVQK